MLLEPAVVRGCAWCKAQGLQRQGRMTGSAQCGQQHMHRVLGVLVGHKDKGCEACGQG